MDEKKYYDLMGREIHVGDLLRSFHFSGRKCGKGRKKYWLYHGVIDNGGVMEMVPVRELCGMRPAGGRCWLKAMATSEEGDVDAEIIAGYGPNGMDYEDRPKRRKSEPR